jgi:hypothetical protein
VILQSKLAVFVSQSTTCFFYHNLFFIKTDEKKKVENFKICNFHYMQGKMKKKVYI